MASGARSGAVTLIQRFGSALNLNVHLHMLFLEGACTFSGSRPTFHRARQPAGEELSKLLDALSRRIVRVLERRGLLIGNRPRSPPALQSELTFTRDGWAQAQGILRLLDRFSGLLHGYSGPIT